MPALRATSRRKPRSGGRRISSGRLPAVSRLMVSPAGPYTCSVRLASLSYAGSLNVLLRRSRRRRRERRTGAGGEPMRPPARRIVVRWLLFQPAVMAGGHRTPRRLRVSNGIRGQRTDTRRIALRPPILRRQTRFGNWGEGRCAARTRGRPAPGSPAGRLFEPARPRAFPAPLVRWALLCRSAERMPASSSSQPPWTAVPCGRRAP